MTIENTLVERERRYGSLKGHAAISQGLKKTMFNAGKWHQLSDDKQEALEMICHKIARILNGDSEYKDNWHDICGYAKLIEDTLNGN